MKISLSLAVFTTIAALCLMAMVTVTFAWMFVPARIIYQESSPVKTGEYSVEVKQHGQSFFITPTQKYILHLIRTYTPIIWFSGFGYLFLFTALGGFARLRLLQRHRVGEGGPP